jgi:hypothetical protein
MGELLNAAADFRLPNLPSSSSRIDVEGYGQYQGFIKERCGR